MKQHLYQSDSVPEPALSEPAQQLIGVRSGGERGHYRTTTPRFGEIPSASCPLGKRQILAKEEIYPRALGERIGRRSKNEVSRPLGYAIHHDVKKHVVRKIYERCDEVSAVYVEKHPEDWLLGGESAILIVDEFPSGYMTEHQVDINCARKRNNNSHIIICIAEVNTIPTRVWLHMIEAVPEPQKMEKQRTGLDRCNMVEEALKEMVRHTVPGSYIVANNRAYCCSYESLQSLKQYKVISVEQLQKFDSPGKRRLQDNLETIWQSAVEVCEEVQEATHTLGQHIIARHLWRQKFGMPPSTAFQYMLNHIAEKYRFSQG
ncbi:hypothetical protein EAI_01492 [Harpegnathos saltator]|uniref:Uncharacterized protein n=1 Tax=Harpegnathos saltator TaxID=610380 RepID=E2BPE7_HARSA|nr:hypothetical protein EAI_01492 [Harpegnathos saltator]